MIMAMITSAKTMNAIMSIKLSVLLSSSSLPLPLIVVIACCPTLTTKVYTYS